MGAVLSMVESCLFCSEKRARGSALIKLEDLGIDSEPPGECYAIGFVWVGALPFLSLLRVVMTVKWHTTRSCPCPSMYTHEEEQEDR